MPKYHVTTERAVIGSDVRVDLAGATAHLRDGGLCLLVPFCPYTHVSGKQIVLSLLSANV